MPSVWARRISSAGSTNSSVIFGLSLALNCAACVVQDSMNISATVQVQLVLRIVYLPRCLRGFVFGNDQLRGHGRDLVRGLALIVSIHVEARARRQTAYARVCLS